MAPPVKLKTMLVDDSVVHRRFLTGALASLEQIGEVSAASSSRTAAAKLARESVDLLFCDLSGGEADLDFISWLAASAPQTVVLVLAGPGSREARLAVAAMERGALEVLTRPRGLADALGLEAFLEELGLLLRGLAGRRAAFLARRMLTGAKAAAGSMPGLAQRPGYEDLPRTAAVKPRIEEPFAAVAIGVSTGGPTALGQVLPLLPENLDRPVLLVQHMPPDFTRAMTASLDAKSRIRVMEAREGDVVAPGNVYVAPGGRHMTVVQAEGAPEPRGMIRLIDSPPVNSCRPSVDVLLESMAGVYGGRVLAVIMTGMGYDGLQGVRAIKERGGYCLTQSAGSCVVYGMPRAVDEAGLADESVSLERLARRITELLANGGGG